MKKLSLIPLAFILAIVAGCGAVVVDQSKMPKNPIYCHTRNECPRGYYCGFPAPDTYACCLPR